MQARPSDIVLGARSVDQCLFDVMSVLVKDFKERCKFTCCFSALGGWVSLMLHT